MRKSFIIGLCLSFATLCFHDASAQETKATVKPAKPTPTRVSCEGLGKDCDIQNAAHAWLRLVDAGDYRQSWYAGGQFLRCRHSEDGWFWHLCKKRKCWGKVISREYQGAEPCCNPEKFPEGSYYWITYQTCFECGSVCEQVAVRCDPDCACGGRWRVVHYSMQ